MKQIDKISRNAQELEQANAKIKDLTEQERIQAIKVEALEEEKEDRETWFKVKMILLGIFLMLFFSFGADWLLSWLNKGSTLSLSYNEGFGMLQGIGCVIGAVMVFLGVKKCD